MIKIDKKVPLPPPTHSGAKYPWRTMEVGDSFFVAEASQFNHHYVNRRLAPKKFTSRKVEGGIRVWRTA